MHPLLQRQMIIWTIILVCAVGTVIGTLMLKPPVPESELAHSPAFLRAQKRLSAKERHRPLTPAMLSQGRGLDGRTPASAASPLAYGERSFQTLDLQIDCQNVNHARLTKDIAQIRLQGTLCTPNEEIVSSEIRNENNGFSATVFMSAPRAFTTDYISLMKGENKIRVLHYLRGGGREEHEFLAHRE